MPGSAHAIVEWNVRGDRVGERGGAIPEEGCVSDGLCVCRHDVVVFVRKIDVAGAQRGQDVFHELEGIVGRSVPDEDLFLA